VLTRRGFRISEAARLTGLTERQLDHWDRTGIFQPSLAPAQGRGSARFYSFLDLVQLRAARKLLDAGLAVPRLRKHLAFLRESLREDRPVPEVLVTDGGDTILLADDLAPAADLLKAGRAVWAVRLDFQAEPGGDRAC